MSHQTPAAYGRYGRRSIAPSRALAVVVFAAFASLPGRADAGRVVDYAAEVQPLFNASCGGHGCHIGESASGVDLTSYRSSVQSLGALYERRVVTPLDAATSPLLDKIARAIPEHGARMPPDAPALTAAEIALISDWIDGGAMESVPPPIRGDIDRDSKLNITDAISLLGFLFLGSRAPYCVPVSDADGNGEVDITDPVNILGFLFLGRAALPALGAAEVDACVSVNFAPRVPPLSVYRTHPGVPVELALGATDPEGDAITYEFLDVPPGATLDASTGIVRWTPEPDQLGPFYLPFIVSDDGEPPAGILRTLAFQVLPVDPCSVPDCDPATGCQSRLLAPGQDCCGSPGARVAEPAADCPGGAVLYVGRNVFGFGRIQGCDHLRAIALGQGGYEIRLNVEARCLRPDLVSVYARLETRFGLLLDMTRQRAFVAGDDGFVQTFGFSFATIAGAPVEEDLEANLTVRVTDIAGTTLERSMRVLMTFERLDDLP